MEPSAVARLPVGRNGPYLRPCAVHDQSGDVAVNAVVDVADVGAQELARVDARWVDDEDTMLCAMLADVLQGRDDTALPRMEGTADVSLEELCVFPHNRQRYGAFTRIIGGFSTVGIFWWLTEKSFDPDTLCLCKIDKLNLPTFEF